MVRSILTIVGGEKHPEGGRGQPRFFVFVVEATGRMARSDEVARTLARFDEEGGALGLASGNRAGRCGLWLTGRLAGDDDGREGRGGSSLRRVTHHPA